MNTIFRGVLPFVAYCVRLQGSEEDILAALDRCVTHSSAVRENFISFGRRLQLQGQVGVDGIHITTQSAGYNSGQVILHGHMDTDTEDEGVCTLWYRLIPNNFALLFDVLLLCIIAKALKNGLVWRNLAVTAVVVLLCLMLSAVSALPLNMRLNEVLGPFAKE